MKNEILAKVPKPVAVILTKKINDQNRCLIDLVVDDAMAYGFNAEEVAPCILSAYYVYESLAYPVETEEEWKLCYIFLAASRSAMKLLSYGKYKAERTESGWMRYANT